MIIQDNNNTEQLQLHTVRNVMWMWSLLSLCLKIPCCTKLVPFPASLNIHQALWPWLLQLEIQQEDSQIFFLLHDFTGRRFILTVGLSDLSIPLPVKLKVFTFSLKALYGLSLAYLNCQHRDSWPLGSLLSKIRVTWSQAIWYLKSQSNNREAS